MPSSPQLKSWFLQPIVGICNTGNVKDLKLSQSHLQHSKEYRLWTEKLSWKNVHTDKWFMSPVKQWESLHSSGEQAAGRVHWKCWQIHSSGNWLRCGSEIWWRSLSGNHPPTILLLKGKIYCVNILVLFQNCCFGHLIFICFLPSCINTLVFAHYFFFSSQQFPCILKEYLQKMTKLGEYIQFKELNGLKS